MLRSSQEGEAIDDVLLPEWAQDGYSFLQNMRAALESDYVSANLNSWIDLIFGYKQKGEEATANDNLFYPLCYEENIDWLKYSVRIVCFSTFLTPFSHLMNVKLLNFKLPNLDKCLFKLLTPLIRKREQELWMYTRPQKSC